MWKSYSDTKSRGQIFVFFFQIFVRFYLCHLFVITALLILFFVFYDNAIRYKYFSFGLDVTKISDVSPKILCFTQPKLDLDISVDLM